MNEKQSSGRPGFKLSAKGQRSLTAGHPWVYAEELSPAGETDLDRAEADNGGLVDVTGTRGQYLGSGFYSARSKIRVRLVSRNANDQPESPAFWRRRLQYAWQYRKAVLRPDDLLCCRLIFGEADQFPGLTVDRYNDILVTQTLSAGMERLKPLIFEQLCDVLRQDGQTINAVYERNDVALREKEGLAQYKGFWTETGAGAVASGTTIISENGVRFEVDYAEGQKTGYFLDQKKTRQAVAELAASRRVLDCFTHTGSFALNAARGGALSVTAVDCSALALQQAAANEALNNFAIKVDWVEADVFDFLPQLGRRAPYDFVILDPPAFAKSRRVLTQALKGYKEINYRAMKALPRGGYLATASCSHFVSPEAFLAMLGEAARDAAVELRQIAYMQQAPDHPILLNVPETAYLKFYLFQVV
ncbi:class I SAM-dependent rRNA methyltransferase [Oscillospiraceae bacterium HV4-5-C5C]|nr:class I SAM-dependent rRNA methyltransferase [Oscillospiraceae bacterium HV4-5-C5C]